MPTQTKLPLPPCPWPKVCQLDHDPCFCPFEAEPQVLPKAAQESYSNFLAGKLIPYAFLVLGIALGVFLCRL